MKTGVPHFTLLVVALIISCTPPIPHRTAHKAIFEYDVLWGASSQKIFDQCARATPDARSFFVPDPEQIDTLFVDIEKIRNDIEKKLSVRLEGYKYQIVGFDTRYMYLNCFLNSKDMGIIDWRSEAISSCEKGNAYWGIIYTIDTRNFSRFEVNGTR